MHHAAAANELGTQESRIDRVEDRVAVRSVDHRMEFGLQVNRIAAGFQAEIRRIGFAVYRNMLKHAAIFACRRQNAADAVKYAKIACSKAIVARDGVERGSSRCQGPKRPVVSIIPGGLGLVSLASNAMA